MCFRDFLKPDSRKTSFFAVYFAISLFFLIMGLMSIDFPPAKTTTVLVFEAVVFVITLGSSLLTLLIMSFYPKGLVPVYGMTIVPVVFLVLIAAQAIWAYLVSCTIVSIYEKISKKPKQETKISKKDSNPKN